MRPATKPQFGHFQSNVALRLAKEHGVVEPGDLVVVTAGDPGTSPTQGDYTTSTNMIMVCQIQ